MASTEKQEIIARLNLIQSQCEDLKQLVNQLIDEKEYYTTSEAAKLAGIKPKTATNYCSTGIWKAEKDPRGRYLVHRSELSDFL